MSLQKILLPFLIIGSLFLQGCSYQEYFMVFNQSDKDVHITYQLKEIDRIGIFEKNPVAYQLNENGGVAWEKQLDVDDKAEDPFIVEVKLPPNAVLHFGRLSNDNYHNSEQEFINGRNFNLEEISIQKTGENKMEINREEFDDYFKNMSGKIRYTVK